jgi:hypothetical protein
LPSPTAKGKAAAPTAAQTKAWEDVSKRAADAAAGTVYPQNLLNEVRAAVADHRAGSGK